MNRDFLNLTVHVFTEHLPGHPLWCVQFAAAPAGWFRSRGDCPKTCFAAAWDSFIADQVAQLPTWLRIRIPGVAGDGRGRGDQVKSPSTWSNAENRHAAGLSANFTR